MSILAKIVAIAAALTLTTQPCIAAAVDITGAPAGAALTPSAAERVDFDLRPHLRSAAAQTNNAGLSGLIGGSATVSLSLAASQQTAAEAEDRPQRRGPGTTTWLIIGGAVLLVAIAAAVASAAPTPGPHEGAFD